MRVNASALATKRRETPHLLCNDQLNEEARISPFRPLQPYSVVNIFSNDTGQALLKQPETNKPLG